MLEVLLHKRGRTGFVQQLRTVWPLDRTDREQGGVVVVVVVVGGGGKLERRGAQGADTRVRK